MRILHVTQATATGVDQLVRALVRHQIGLGWDVHVASPDSGTLVDWLSTVPAEWHDWPAERDSIRRVPSEIRRLHEIVDLVQPTAVHLHSSRAGLVGRLSVRGHRTTIFEPHAWSFHAVEGPRALAARLWERLSTRWTHLIVSGSPGETAAGGDVSGALARRTLTTLNPIDVDAFPVRATTERRTAREHLGLEDTPIVVCVGRICRQKGQDVLLEAWRTVREQVPTAHLYLVGEDQSESPIGPVPDGVTICGHRDDVRMWFVAADLVVQPSRYETLSLSTLEALATGCRVVTSQCEGMSEALRFGGGASVPTGDAPLLARAIVDELGSDDGPPLWAEDIRRAHDPGLWATEVTAATLAVAESRRGTISRRDR